MFEHHYGQKSTKELETTFFTDETLNGGKKQLGGHRLQ